jgi:dTDP-4-dehydrorhamnose 3,5-epimerase
VSLTFRELEIPGAFLVGSTRHGDGRGFLEESHRLSAFRDAGIPDVFVQDNVTRTVRNALRGLHFQAPPMAQGKLVRVTRGRVYDVGVDLRVGSPTFGRWIGMELEGQESRSLYLPPGLAHGYCVLSEEADLTYKMTSEYAPSLEGGVRWDDPTLAIPWPVSSPIVSNKDRDLPMLEDLVSPFRYRIGEQP